MLLEIGRQGERREAGVEAMAAAYLQSIRSIRPNGPYLLGGWSMGGVIAYEIAQQLRDQGQEIAMLVMMDSFLFPENEIFFPNEIDLFSPFSP